MIIKIILGICGAYFLAFVLACTLAFFLLKNKAANFTKLTNWLDKKCDVWFIHENH